MARKTSLPGMLDAVEREAVEFLREHEPPEGYQLCFSGGKDSIVMRHLADMAGVKYTALFNCTTIDPPEVYRFIRREYPDTVWHFPKQNFFKLILTNGPPWSRARWCCRALKESGDIPGLTHLLIGIRAEESVRRANRPRVEVSTKKRGCTFYAPIHQWKDWQIWEHIERYGLAYPSLYDEGYSRIGCKLCPLSFNPSPQAQMRLQEKRKRYPVFVKKFESALKIWFDRSIERRTAEGKELKHKTFDEFLASYYTGFKDRDWKKEEVDHELLR